MDLPPPPHYALLLGSTLLALPLITRLASTRQNARLARRVLLSIALLEAALIVLFYSVLACWILAGTAAMLLVAHAQPAERPVLVPTMFAVSLVAGLAFQFLPGETGFVAYFAVGLPIMFGPPLALLAARWIRWDQRPTTLLAGAAVLAFAGLLAADAFAQNFLELFEASHLAVTILALLALAWLMGRGGDKADAARTSAMNAMDAGEYTARPLVPLTVAIGFGGVSFVATAAGLTLLAIRVSESFGIVAVAAGLLLAGVLIALRRPGPVLAGSFALFAAALLMPVTPVHQHYLQQDPVVLWPYLTLGAIGATAALIVMTIGWAAMQDARRREHALAPRNGVPASFLQYVQPGAPDIQRLETFADEIRRQGAPAGILSIGEATRDPFATLADDVYSWLERHNDPEARVHVAFVDAGQTYHVPPIAPEEYDG